MTITIIAPAVHIYLGDTGPHTADITQRLENIMTTQAEFALQIAALTEQNEKARAEVLAKIADLQAAIDAAAEVDPAVLAAFDALKVSVQADDDIVPG
jgi:hypothetical protein